MASSNGSSACRPARRASVPARCRRIFAVFLAATVAGRAAPPEYFREALAKFSAEVPPGWAYTQTTVRGDESTVERFDPGRPPAEQWVLVAHNGKPPPPEELEKYGKFKAASAPPLAQAAFHRNDIDPGSIRLERDEPDRGVFSAGFRPEASAADKMLDHLRLELVVHKQPAWVEEYALELLAPYSPVLGVKMNQLSVRFRFNPPGPDRPSLPALSTSWFAGRIFFVPTSEDLRVSFTEFARAGAGR
ncbi:MAG TPA: hypothetical protein VHD61_14390 [Lacunisphaera sp.]|nr:hypothetical protein [Lacunisphaera sp.]